MEPNKVTFDTLEWQSRLPGARFRVFREGARLMLVEFTPESVEPHWCEKGHAGLVPEGELEIDFRGRVVRYPAGSGLIIAPGPEGGHEARSLTPVVRPSLVEDVK